MTLKQLSLVLVLVAALAAGVVGVQLGKKKDAEAPAESRRGEKVFPNLPVEQIASVTVTKKGSSVTLTKSDTGWGVAERGSYTANFPNIRELLLDFSNLKIVDTVNVSADHYGMFNLEDPNDAESDEEKSAIAVELKGADGTALATLFIGKEPLEDGAQNRERGIDSKSIYVRTKGQDEVLLLNKTAPAPTASPGGFPPMSALSGWLRFTAEPSDWIDKAFFNVSNASTIEVTHPEPADSWKVVKTPGEDGGEDTWDLVDLEPGMVLDIDSKASGIRYLLTNPTFREVVTPEKAKELDWAKGAISAIVTTDDGFKYELTMMKTKPEEESSDYFLKVNTTAEIAETRPAVEGESEEEKLRNEADFAAQRPRLILKLKKEEAFNGWVFEISEYNLSALLKKRSEIIKEEEKEEPVSPNDPEVPADPTDPTDPNIPTIPLRPTDSTDPEDTPQPTEPSEPTEPTEPANPETPVDPPAPTEPTEPSPPAEAPTAPAEPAAPDEPLSPAQPESPEPSETSPDTPDSPAAPADSENTDS